MPPGLLQHTGWNTEAGVECALQGWREDRPLLLLNPAVAALPGVRCWLDPLLRSGGGPLLEGLEPGFHAILLTSGTTGAPRLVALHRASVLWNIETLAQHLDLPDDGSLTTLLQVPIFHAFGLVLTLLLSETRRGRLLTLERFSPEGLRAQLDTLRTVGGGGSSHLLLPFVPTMVRALYGALPPQPFRGTAIVGGDRVRWSDLEGVRALFPGVTPTIGYGLTEAGPALTHTAGVRPPALPGTTPPSLGLPLPGVQLFPPQPGADPTLGWHFQSPGQAVAVRGPGDSIWQPTQGTPLPTGDQLRVDPKSGEVHFEGRASWCFKWQGETLSPLLLEEALRDAEPELPEFVVVQGEGGAPELWVESAERGKIREAFERASGTLPPFLRPHALRWTEALPRNALGKVSRSSLCASQS
jgi:acyl-CoA synthetase (AMP-forming)/AMP-acid ligase II